MIPQLGADPASDFPDPGEALADPDGLLAWGGDLDPVRLIHAYHHGIFPWFSDDQPILWWSPARRCVLDPAAIRVTRRLQRTMARGGYRITADSAFADVVLGCAKPRDGQPGTWITTSMMEAYGRLHRMGLAHSIEIWKAGRLVGGLYGLSLGRVFFGESMYSDMRDASKIILVHLCRQLAQWHFPILDCQVSNPHLESMGACTIDRDEFIQLLQRHVARPAPDQSFKAALETGT
ncbi:MAG: leucyl/phenylalanyl-tRNA--protein transferase [Gammaproteobacteria bacterium]|nr:leucyl/phenylalanyl-tRNA--protein transferase [Gammaproteobacteria bacterium]NNE04473.1 leucyl/phenylalanyl-tRNA--protein transferase [Xanthomonadales bacterium]